MQTLPLCEACLFTMTKKYELLKFFCFCILIKRQYVNSIILGTCNEISHKINTSYYLTKKYLNYGLKNGLIVKTKKGYKVASYNKLIQALGLPAKIENYSFSKEGNLQELIIKNSFVIALHNFKAQEFKIKEKKNILSIRNKIATGQVISKKEYNKRNKTCANLNESIVTGQKHLSKILGFSQNTSYNLLKIWDSVGYITREVVFSKKVDPFYNDYLLNMNLGKMIVLGSKISINHLVVTKI